jgi:uncharacterized membrane protein YdjX (TVP38/TMEM64 family)
MADTSAVAPSDSSRPYRSWLRRYGRWFALALVVGIVAAVYLAGGAEGLGQWIREHWGHIRAWVDDNLLLAVATYFLLYVLVTGLSIPIANVLSIAAGALFGRWLGVALVSFASTAGATLAFLGSRYLFRDWVRQRLGERFEAINRNIEREGAFYLFTLRLMIVVPFWMVNLALGLTTMRVWTFWWVSQIGMLPGAFLYVNAGAAAGGITEWRDIFTWPIIVSFAVLGVAPLLFRAVVKRLRRNGA